MTIGITETLIDQCVICDRKRIKTKTRFAAAAPLASIPYVIGDSPITTRLIELNSEAGYSCDRPGGYEH
jgi:hypothetical protein